METKQCMKCKEVLPLEMFRPRKDRGNRLHSWCVTCCSVRLNRVMENRAKKVAAVAAHKEEKGCIVCGLSVAVALDLHHLDPDAKEDSIAQMFAKHKSLEHIFKEIEKCVVICSNHHRMLHAGLITLPC